MTAVSAPCVNGTSWKVIGNKKFKKNIYNIYIPLCKLNKRAFSNNGFHLIWTNIYFCARSICKNLSHFVFRGFNTSPVLFFYGPVFTLMKNRENTITRRILIFVSIESLLHLKIFRCFINLCCFHPCSVKWQHVSYILTAISFVLIIDQSR